MAFIFDKKNEKTLKKELDDQIELEQAEQIEQQPQLSNLKSEDVAVDTKKYMQNLNNFIMSKFKERKNDEEIEKH